MASRAGKAENRGWAYRAAIYSTVVSALGYLAFSLWGGWQEVAGALARVGLGGLLFALGMSLLNYVLRFLRWQSYLAALGHALAWRPSFGIYLAGFALSATPGKIGETIRSGLLKRHGVPYGRSLAALLSERLSDLLTITGLAAIGLGHYPQTRPVAMAGLGITLAALLLLSQHRLIRQVFHWLEGRRGRLVELSRHALTLLLDARRCHSPLLLATSSLLSLAGWGAEALAFHYLLQWLGADVSLTFSVFVYAASTLAGAISFMPGGLGGTEAVMVALLLGNGIPQADAIAATLVIRLATLWFAVGIGALALSRTDLPRRT
ncbi:lysylphosphatidylglycerol synthase transmembrane domain-containing protein [Phytopseudomonas dryadis]|uniref:TIGR00374 family protein n=1 Tax=Phytopseudomonas dryadis TaxID=2487520 RepID=A0ABY1ZCZ6_9GAMM|nr:MULTISPECIES: lysylphosphatidylglycerol synthase transmembrane domain-containing protein [Pseudomonas]TBV09268.1 TIGR00374 family protein [Pseudomonas dryadis]TBV12986.1 TIGR00374 family protein [Pseudomonas sp. FRB 230]